MLPLLFNTTHEPMFTEEIPHVKHDILEDNLCQTLPFDILVNFWHRLPLCNIQNTENTIHVYMYCCFLIL